jgi:hypothetical protein
MALTLAELAEKYKSGELTEREPLWLDNDDTYVYTGQTGPATFSMHPNELLEQALTLLGIPHKHV